MIFPFGIYTNRGGVGLGKKLNHSEMVKFFCWKEKTDKIVPLTNNLTNNLNCFKIT